GSSAGRRREVLKNEIGYDGVVTVVCDRPRVSLFVNVYVPESRIVPCFFVHVQPVDRSVIAAQKVRSPVLGPRAQFENVFIPRKVLPDQLVELSGSVRPVLTLAVEPFEVTLLPRSFLQQHRLLSP